MKNFITLAALLMALSVQAQDPPVATPILDSGNDLASELTRVTQLKNGIQPAESTGTRGGGNAVIVDIKSLEEFISSGGLRQAVKEAIVKIDPAKSIFSDTANDWEVMLSRGLIDDISQTPYTFSETGNCTGSIDQGTGASTEANLKAPVCWDLQHLISIHDSMDTLVNLGIREEARHFGFDYNSTRVIAEMAARQLRTGL